MFIVRNLSAKIRYFTNPTIRIQAQVELEFNNRINPPPSKEITFIEYFGRKSRPNTPKSAYVRFRRSIPFTFLKINRFFLNINLIKFGQRKSDINRGVLASSRTKIPFEGMRFGTISARVERTFLKVFVHMSNFLLWTDECEYFDRI